MKIIITDIKKPREKNCSQEDGTTHFTTCQFSLLFAPQMQSIFSCVTPAEREESPFILCFFESIKNSSQKSCSLAFVCFTHACQAEMDHDIGYIAANIDLLLFFLHKSIR